MNCESNKLKSVLHHGLIKITLKVAYDTSLNGRGL
jgi:hypothetical protein